MDYYFISHIPYHLKINGNYFGTVTSNLSVIKNQTPTFFEFLPTSENYHPLYSAQTPTESVKFYNFLKGKLITVSFKKRLDNTFKILEQKTFNLNGVNYLVSVVVDGVCKFYVDGQITLIEKLPLRPTSFDVLTYKNLVFFAFFGKTTTLYGYDFSTPNAKVIFKDIISDFELSTTLKVKRFYPFINPLTITEVWELSSPLNLLERRSEFSKNIHLLNRQLLPLSFMETASVYGEIDEYLAPNLKERKSDLLQFIKKPIYLFSSPENHNEIINISSDGLFTYSLEFDGNKITNLIEK